MMDANKILQVDALDLIFEGRNKDYGAYELRTNYKKRLLVAVGGMIALCGCMIVLNSFAGKSEKQTMLTYDPIVILDKVVEPDKVEPPKVEPPKPPKKIETIQFTTPKVTNEEVKPDEMPPPIDNVKDVKIGVINTPGEKGDDIVAPPNDGGGTGVIEAPKKKDDDNEIHLTVQIESEYPGGLSAWLRFLTKTLPKYYTGDLVEQEIQGRVLVQFIVDKDGNVSSVEGVEGPKELREAAEKVIRLSGKWTPAIQNGRPVKSYKRQPIIFRLEE